MAVCETEDKKQDGRLQAHLTEPEKDQAFLLFLAIKAYYFRST